MTVFSYDIHRNLVDHHEFLEELKNFCSAQGWTIDDWRKNNTQWAFISPGVYGWQPGSESFLEVTSSGYGSQSLNFRFRGEASGSDPDHEWIQMGAHLEEVIDTGSPLHPVEQNTWSANRHTSYNPDTLPVTWFFGDDKFILAVVKLNNTYVQFLSFGSLELFDTSEDEGNFAGYSGFSSGTYKWYLENNFSPFDGDANNIYYDAGLVNATRYGNTLQFDNSNNQQVGDFARYGRAITRNAYSEKRPVMKPTVFVKHESDDLWRGLGKFPIYRINHTGLAIGEIVEYDTEEYITFPNCKGNDVKYRGIAVRIA